MFSTVRQSWVLGFVLLSGCGETRTCCHIAVKAEENAAPAEKDDTKPDVAMYGNGPGRNQANPTEQGVPVKWVVEPGKEFNVLWTAKLGTNTYGGPVVAGGKIFVSTTNESPRDPAIKGDKGVVMCFDQKTGKFLWQIVHDKLDNAGLDAEKCGVASTPAVEGKHLHYVSNRCELVCADVEGDPKNPGKGKIVWSLDMIGKLDVHPGGISGGLANSSPLVIGDLVYVLTSNGTENAKVAKPKAPSLIAVNKKTGEVVWSDNSPGEKIMDGQWSSPVGAEVNGEWQIIYGAGDGWLYGFEAKKGELRWKFDCNPKKSAFKPGGRGDRNYIVATPVVVDNKLYVGVGQEPDSGPGVGHLWCIDLTKKPTNKDKDLSPVNDNFDPKAPENKDSGLFWHYGGPVVPKPAPGKREHVFGRTLSTVAVHDGLVYAAELTGFLHCLDAKTGKPYWSYDLKESTWNSPYYVDGRVLMGVDNGNLYVFQHGKDFKEPAVIEMDQALKTPPVAVNGVLYISNGLNLYAIGVKK